MILNTIYLQSIIIIYKMKQRIRLTESQLNEMIVSALNEELDEGWWDSVKGGVKSFFRQVGNGIKDAPDDLAASLTSKDSIGKEVKDGVKGMPSTASNFFSRIGQDSRNASVAADARKAAELLASIRENQPKYFQSYERGHLTSTIRYLVRMANDLETQQINNNPANYNVARTNTSVDMGKYNVTPKKPIGKKPTVTP